MESVKVGFLIGTPRCGKSRALDILVSSSYFAWVSSYLKNHLDHPFVSLYNKIYDIPSHGKKLYLQKDKNKFFPRPIETNSYWRKHLLEFEEVVKNKKLPIDPQHCPSLKNQKDISDVEIKKVRKLLKKICKWQGKNHFIMEYSKWPRMTYFTQPFPNCKFVNIIRDGRAVATEYVKMINKGNYVEWDFREWWIKGWPKEWKKKYLKNYSDSILGFCAYLWKFQLRLIWKDAERISDNRYKEVKYRDIVEKPKDTFSDILNFFGVEYNKKIDWYIEQKDLKNMNYKWKKELNENQKRMLDEIIHEPEYVELLDPDV